MRDYNIKTIFCIDIKLYFSSLFDFVDNPFILLNLFVEMILRVVKDCATFCCSLADGLLKGIYNKFPYLLIVAV